MGRGIVIAVLAGIASTVGVSRADDRPRLEVFAAGAPAWVRDCTVDLVEIGERAFSVAIACRGSEELIFERHAKRSGPRAGSIASFDGATRLLVWRTTRYATDVYTCTSTAEQEPVARCRSLVDAVMQSTIARRGAAAFARPKS